MKEFIQNSHLTKPGLQNEFPEKQKKKAPIMMLSIFILTIIYFANIFYFIIPTTGFSISYEVRVHFQVVLSRGRVASCA